MTDRERVEEIRETIRKNRDRNDWMHRGPCSMRDALDLLAHVDALTDEVERLRQERRDVTQWRDQTLAAENERLREAQERAERVVQMPCESCVKGCDEDCWSNILLRVLRQQPATRCPMCSEWWDGPVEEDGGSPILSAKQIECPFCTKLEAAAQAVEEK